MSSGAQAPPGLTVQFINKRNPARGNLPSVGKNQNQAKLASLDWPPPPSPLYARSSGDKRQTAGLGPTSAYLAEKDRHYPISPTKPADTRARAELWNLRAEIEREKLRNVAPYPFFGRQMRFQDEFSALQITDDGRFSYSTVSFQATDASERAPSAGGGHCRRVTTYEGIFVPARDCEGPTVDTNAANNSGNGANGGAGGGPEEKGATSSRGDPEVAAIEGKALACHVIVEEGCGRIRLESVQSGTSRFSITVTPFYQPTLATVQPLVQSRSPGRPPPRRRQLPYVSPGKMNRRSSGISGFDGCSLSPKGLAIASGLNATVAAELKQTKRRGPVLKFSSSTPILKPETQDGRMFLPATANASDYGACKRPCSGSAVNLLGHSSSLPSLTPLEKEPY